MAKKKKTTKKKKVTKTKAQVKTPNYMLRRIFAIITFIVGVFILLGALGMDGDKLPSDMYERAAWLFGFGAYLVPFVLIYWSIHKLRHQENVIPKIKFFGGLLFLVSLAGMLHSVLDPEQSAEAANAGQYGGHVGSFVSGIFLSFLNKATAFVVLLLMTIVGFMMMFSLTPKVLWQKLTNLFIREDKADEAESELEPKPAKNTFELRESVPVEHHKETEDDTLSTGPRHASFKNTITPLTAAETHTALLTTSDPNWKIPPLTLLSNKQDKANPGDVQGNVDRIKQALSNFGIDVEMEGANIGPRVTQYTLRTPNGVKMSKIVGLADNIAYELEATSVRIEAPIPGKKAVGIEVPNRQSATVTLRAMLNRPQWQSAKKPLTFAVGLDIAGEPVYLDLAEMPHLLVAGQTKAGKSVLINTFLTSLLYRNSPADLKLIMVDPKFVELEPYNDIPHLLTPVVNDPEKCISALKWAVAEMERRYRQFKDYKVRNIDEYNANKQEEGMPYIVIVIDELSDLMQMAARDVEALIVRIAQKARAVGIHLVLATQRPSVDVITGLIKANVPARMAFTVASQVDSRTIIDQIGAEKLLGMGDMLMSTPETPKPKRIQGAFISTEETKRFTEYLRDQQLPSYDDEVVSMPVQLNGKGGLVPDYNATTGSDGNDDMFKDAVRVVVESQKASTSLLQRRLRIGYGRASRIMDEMEEQGIIGQADGSRPREVLIRSVDEAFGGGAPTDVGPRQIEVSEDPRDEYLTR